MRFCLSENLHALIPHSFYQHYYCAHGRYRDFELCSILWPLILQRIFSIPTDTLLIIFLKFSRELRDFCGFNRVPHASKLTRFKKKYLMDLQSLFHRLVDVTEPICQKIDADKAMMTIFDTSGIEAYVTENNPKFANKIIKQLKAFKKSHQLDNAYNPYKAAYGSMPTHAKSNPEIKQLYINGHFCYVYKFGIITNGLGIVRDITFYDPDCPVNADGIPCCPNDPSLPMKSEGRAKRKNRLIRFKFTCPKTKWIKQEAGKAKRQCFCENPCTPSSCGRMFYIYPEKNLRVYPDTLRGTLEWVRIYKIWGVVEQSINHFKDSFCLANRKTQNAKTLHADLLLDCLINWIAS